MFVFFFGGGVYLSTSSYSCYMKFLVSSCKVVFLFSFLFSCWFCHCIFIYLLSNAFSGICLILLSLSGEFPKWEWNLGRKKVAWYLGGTSNDYCVINTGNKLSQYLSKKKKKKLSQYNNKTYILRTESRRQRMVFIFL